MRVIYGACICPESKISLPDEICIAAIRGKLDKVLLYLHKGDPNASYGYDGWTILGAACSMGRSKIVEKMLQVNDLHLNKRSMQDTPLGWALKGEHDECVELLLKSSLKCSLDLNRSWIPLAGFMERKPLLWFDVVNIIASSKDFDKLENLLKFKNKNFEVDSSLIEVAALEPSCDKVLEYLKKNPDAEKYLDGTLIAVSCLGTNEEVAKALIGHSHEYNQKSIELSLYLCSINQNFNVLVNVLRRFFAKISYNLLCDTCAAAKEKSSNTTRLLERAIDLKCQILLPSIEDSRFYVVPGHIPSIVEETPGTSASTQTFGTPAEAIELGTPALELSKRPALELSKRPISVTDQMMNGPQVDASPKRSTLARNEVGDEETVQSDSCTVEDMEAPLEITDAASKVMALATKSRAKDVVVPMSSSKGLPTFRGVKVSPTKRVAKGSPRKAW